MAEFNPSDVPALVAESVGSISGASDLGSDVIEQVIAKTIAAHPNGGDAPIVRATIDGLIRAGMAGDLAGSGLFGIGVEAVTVCFRPNQAPDNPGNTTFVVHGPHVLSFTRPAAGLYHITLDRAYEDDELAILATPLSAMDDVAANFDLGGPGEGTWQGTVVEVPVVWGTGPNGEKNIRMVAVHALFIDHANLSIPGVMVYNNRHSDPIVITIFFFDRTKSQYRSPAL